MIISEVGYNYLFNEHENMVLAPILHLYQVKEFPLRLCRAVEIL